MSSQDPPFTISSRALTLASEISIAVAGLSADRASATPRLRRVNRIRSIQSSVEIEGNTLTVDQVTDIIDGKRVLGDPREIQEVKNAFDAYALIPELDPLSIDDLLKAHGVMMRFLVDRAGSFRSGNVAVRGRGGPVHVAPPPSLVPELMSNLFGWLSRSEDHPLIKACVFHYEFEFIHPFPDGNGRMGRLWHKLLLTGWMEEFAWIPMESVVRDRQDRYYEAINRSTQMADSGPFIDFMLEATRDAILEVQRAGGSGADTVESKVLEMIRRGDFVNADLAARALSVSSRTVSRALKSLREDGRIVREGSDRKGRWIATDDVTPSRTASRRCPRTPSPCRTR